VSNVPFGSGAASQQIFTSSPGHVSTLSGRAPARIRPVIPGQRRRTADAAWVSRRLSAHRHSLLGHPVPPGDRPSLRSAHRAFARILSGFPRSARVRHDRVGCPLYPGDGGALPVGGSAVRPAPAASQRPAL